jgi:ATP-binding cassette subfamily C protein LapB
MFYDEYKLNMGGQVSIKGTFNSATIMAASLAINIAGLMMPLVILQVYDKIIPNQAHITLISIAVLVILAILFETVLKIARQATISWISFENGFQKSSDAISRTLGEPQKMSVAEKHVCFEALGEVTEFNSSQTKMALLDIPFASIFLIAMYLIGGAIALIPIGILLLFTAYATARTRRLKQNVKARTDNERQKYDFLSECLAYIETIKVQNSETSMIRRFEQIEQRHGRILFNSICHNDETNATSQLLNSSMYALIVTYGAFLAIHNLMSIGSIVACSMLASRMVQPVTKGIFAWSEIQSMKNSMKESEKLFELKQFHRSPSQYQLTSSPHIDIVVQDAAEDFQEPWKLHIPSGSIVSIIGNETQATRILRIIAGLESSSQSSVFIEGKHSSEIWSSDTKCTGYLPKQSKLFRGTILENITHYDTKASIQRAREISQRLGLERIVNTLPDGYETMVGIYSSEQIAEGLVQLINLCRVFSSDAKILVLDQPQTALDRQADQNTMAHINSLRGRVTTIFSSTRPAYSRFADIVIDLNTKTVSRQDNMMKNSVQESY